MRSLKRLKFLTYDRSRYNYLLGHWDVVGQHFCNKSKYRLVHSVDYQCMSNRPSSDQGRLN